MTEPKPRNCPACKGAGKFYEANVFGGTAATCGHCLGFGEVTRETAEAWLDQQPITRGEVKRLISDAIRDARRPSKMCQTPRRAR